MMAVGDRARSDATALLHAGDRIEIWRVSSPSALSSSVMGHDLLSSVAAVLGSSSGEATIGTSREFVAGGGGGLALLWRGGLSCDAPLSLSLSDLLPEHM
jgi:hypothetical protein